MFVVIFKTVETALKFASSVADKIWPDPLKKAEGMLKLEELAQKGDLAQLNAEVQLMMGQININLEQAKSKSFFVAGARPFIIWICGIALGLSYFVPMIMEWVAYFQCEPMIYEGRVITECVVPGRMDMGALMPVLLGLLGLGGMRSWDKKNGTQTDKIK